MRLVDRPVAVPLLFLTILVFLALLPLWQGRFFATGDMRDVYLPIEHFFHQQQLSGHLPTWMPSAAWGYPIIASAQIGFFYPPLLLLRLLPIFIYFPLLIFLNYLWLSFGTYLFLKHLRFSTTASLIATVSFAFGGFITLHLTHLNILLTLSWLPWQFLAAYYLTRKPFLFPFIVYALALGIPFLAGQLQIPTLMAAVSTIWYLYLRLQRGYSWPKTILHIFLLSVIAFFISSAQTIPTLELMLHSTRSSSSSYDITRANQHSYPLYHLPTTIFPRFFGNDDTFWGKRLQIEYGFYLGTIPTWLTFIVVTNLFFKKKFSSHAVSKTILFWLWLLLISFLFSLGELSPFRLIGLEPTLWIFSAPARWLLFSSFSLAVLTAFSADYLTKHHLNLKKPLIFSLSSLLIFLILFNLLLFVFDQQILSSLSDLFSPTHLSKLQSMLASARQSSVSFLSLYTYLPLASLLIFFLWLKFAKKPLLLFLIIFLELLILFATTTPTLPWSRILDPPQSVASLPADVSSGQARLYSIRDGGDTGAYFTNPESRADSQARETLRQLLVPLTHSIHGLSGIEWPASLDLSNSSSLLAALRQDDSYEITDYNLAADLNIGAILTPTEDSIRVQSLSAKPRIELITNSNKSQSIVYPKSSSSHITFPISTTEASTIILRDTIYPGWQAYIDDHPVPIIPYLHIFKSIVAPAGDHQITFAYTPLSIYIGIFTSSLTLLGCSIALYYSRSYPH